MKKEQLSDVEEIIKWLTEKENDLDENIQIDQNEDGPVLYKLFSGRLDELDEATKKRYSKYLSTIGKATMGAGIYGLGGMAVKTVGMGALRSVGMGIGGIALAPLLLNPVAWIGGGLIYTFASKKIKSSEGKKFSEQLEKLSERFKDKKEKLSKKMEENAKEIKRLSEEYVPIALAKIKETSEKVAIQIDDLANMDQNKRIMQYQKIVLNQYQEQNQLRTVLEDINKLHNQLMRENEELIVKLQKYEEYESCCYQTNEILD